MTKSGIVVALVITIVLANGLNVTFGWQQRVVQVLPDIPDDRYLGNSNCTVSDCYTFSELVWGHSVRGSNLKVVLLPGIHIANYKPFFITGVYYSIDVTNFTLSAANLTAGATILCNGTFGFAFLNVTNLEISGLTFENCGEAIEVPRTPYTSSPYYTLYIVDSINVNITDVAVRYGRGYGLYVKQPRGLFTLSRARFVFNENNFRL